MVFIFICILSELSQLLMASFSCEPSLYFFTGRYSEPCRFRHHVALGQLSLCQEPETSLKSGITTGTEKLKEVNKIC